MASIDNRVVEMKFDNAAFQTKVDSTIKSIEKLDASLKLAEGTQGLKNVDAASKELNFGGISSALENITSKFNIFSMVGITTLVNLTNKAVDAGIALGKSLSLDQTIQGFREYETNMRSIQTILANTRSEGATLDQVNNALDILNAYSDQTIYNFSQMTRNIGTFTAAGVKLDTAVGSIKGIANLAAVSGSSAEQAANAMYQLSQAISTGSLKLMDWNSVVNAGMGGKVFQTALFETGKTLGTIKNVPIDQTFDEWTKAGNTFRGSLEEGWVTADVLTQTLRNFTGELTKEQLLAIGYTDKQAQEIVSMANTAVEAATKVRTLTQLIDVAREAVASGWSQSWRIIIGDFEEATNLFSGVSSAFGTMVGNSAKARNELLQQWSDFGGRTALIDALTNSAKALGAIINAVKDAFREIFPPITAVQLTKLTWAFQDFAKNLIPTKVTIVTIKTVFKGIFSVFEIGVTIVKEIANSFKTLFGALSDSKGSTEVLRFVKDFSKDLVKLNEVLVDGGLIAKVFETITDAIIRFAKDPIGELNKLKDIAVEVFNVLSSGTEKLGNLPPGVVDFLLKVRDALSNLGDATPFFAILLKGFDHLKDIVHSFGPIIDALEQFADYIINWFKGLFAKMGAAAEPGDFSKVLDAVNLGIVASIGGLLAFLKKGISVDLAGGLFDKIKGSIDEVSGTLKAMQTDLKANALLKIAIAIGVLAISILLLASVDSVDLTKALTAISVGIGQLILTFQQISKISGPKQASAFTIASAGLIALSGAVLLLAFAIRILSKLSVADLTQGLIAVSFITESLVAVSKQLSTDTKGLVKAGIGLIGVAIALNILAVAVKLFSLMDLGEMIKGLIGITLGLTAITVALRMMPADTLSKGAGLILIASALNILAIAVTIFSKMSWNEIIKGFGSVGIGLTLIAIAMHLMPTNLIVTASGLLVVSAALIVIALALKEIANLTWNDLAKGLVAIAGALIMLTIAAHAMQGALAGAAAMTVMSVALILIADALRTIGTLSWSEIIKGLVGIAATFAVIAIAATLIQPAIGAILGLGAALLLIGVAVAAFGIGINALARGIRILVEMGETAIDWFVALLDKLLERIPILAKALAIALVETIDIVLDALPVIIEQLGVIIGYLIDTLIQLMPKFEELIIALIDTIIRILDEKTDDIIAAGFRLLMSLLSGISENIGNITDVVIDIILKFISALTDRIGEIVTAGINLLVAFLKGITDNLSKVIVAVGKLIAEVIRSIGTFVVDIMNAGVDVLVQFLQGITDNLVKVIDAVTQVITTFITEIGNSTGKLIEAGAKTLVDFIDGITQNLTDIGAAATNLITTLIDELGKNSQKIIDAGGNLIMDLLDGLATKGVEIADAAFKAVVKFLNGLAWAIRDNRQSIVDAGKEIAKALINGMTFGLAYREGIMDKFVREHAHNLVDFYNDALEIKSPSKKFIEIGKNVVDGLALGISNTDSSDKSSIGLAKRTVDNFRSSLTSLSSSLNFTDEFNPTITPVLDLTNVKMGAKSISDLVNASDNISSTITFRQAQTIAGTETQIEPVNATQATTTDVKFEQNIYSPTQLTTADIYRQTRNQITLAKEELNIL